MEHRIIPRAEWGARHPNGAGNASLPAGGVWLHHSVTIAPDVVPPFDDDFAAVRTLERIGQDRFGRGISYTFVVTPAGLIFEGHSVDRIGAHTAGRNAVDRAICLVGNYETDVPTEQQVDAAAWLLAHGFLAGWWRAAPLLGGHRDVKGTACPGRHAYAAIPAINRQAKAYVDGLVPARSDPAPPDEEDPDDMPLQLIYDGDVPGQVWLVDGLEMEPVNDTAQMQNYQAAGIAGPVEINYGHWRLLRDRWARTLARQVVAELPAGSGITEAQIRDAVKAALREGTG